MKKFLEILGGISVMGSISSSVVSCSTIDYSFNLTTEIGEVIDTFDKRDVEDYYFKYWSNTSNTTEVIINFKSKNSKDYGLKSGDCAYWLKHLVEGLRQKPAQDKYGKEPIPKWAWQKAWLWDYEHDRPLV